MEIVLAHLLIESVTECKGDTTPFDSDIFTNITKNSK